MPFSLSKFCGFPDSRHTSTPYSVATLLQQITITMKTLKTIKLALGTLALVFFFTQLITAQTFTVEKTNSTIKVDGSSNVHDWTIISESFQGSLTASFENGKLVRLETLEFSVPAENLKSGKGGMDKNTYKALNTKTHKNIIYKLEKVKTLDCNAAGQCKISTSGYLTIAGTRKPVDVIFEAKVSADKIILTGSKEIKMTDYKVDPPTAMLGAITTGDAVTVSLKATFTNNNIQ